MSLEYTLLGIVALLIVARAGMGLTEWFRKAPLTPDPWDPAITVHLGDPDCLPVCHRCLTRQQHDGWHCPQCGAVVGPYANYLPYVYLFSLGEVFRNGVQHHVQRSLLVKVGYIVLSASEYVVFAPLYWYFFFRNLKRYKKIDAEASGPL